jgi:hypothetical protein
MSEFRNVYIPDTLLARVDHVVTEADEDLFSVVGGGNPYGNYFGNRAVQESLMAQEKAFERLISLHGEDGARAVIYQAAKLELQPMHVEQLQPQSAEVAA